MEGTFRPMDDNTVCICTHSRTQQHLHAKKADGAIPARHTMRIDRQLLIALLSSSVLWSCYSAGTAAGGGASPAAPPVCDVLSVRSCTSASILPERLPAHHTHTQRERTAGQQDSRTGGGMSRFLIMSKSLRQSVLCPGGAHE